MPDADKPNLSAFFSSYFLRFGGKADPKPLHGESLGVGIGLGLGSGVGRFGRAGEVTRWVSLFIVNSLLTNSVFPRRNGFSPHTLPSYECPRGGNASSNLRVDVQLFGCSPTDLPIWNQFGLQLKCSNRCFRVRAENAVNVAWVYATGL